MTINNVPFVASDEDIRKANCAIVAGLMVNLKFMQAARIVIDRNVDLDDVLKAISDVMPEHATKIYMQDIQSSIDTVITRRQNT